MKNLALLTLALLLSFNVNAQWGSQKVRGNGKMTTVTRDVGEYDIISVGGFFEVNLIAGEEGSINLEAEENLMDYIITEVKGNALKIRIEDNTNLRTSRNKTIRITIPFEDLEEVNLAGSAKLRSEEVIKADRFATSVAGSGNVSLEVQAREVTASVSGSGSLNLSGTADEVAFKLSGSGNLNAEDLTAVDAEASVTGSGNLRLVCDGGLLKARTTGSGNITYSGKPSREDFKTIGSGKISN